MVAKALFFAILKKLQSGFVRFAPFNILALLWALCLMRNNHVAWDDVEAHRMPLALASGACWGMLSSLAARLVLERRKCHAWRSSSLPALCGIAMTVLGALFWYNVHETDMRYTFWEMLYFGSLVSIGAFSIAQLFGKRNAWTIFGRLFLSAVFVCMISFAVWLGSMLCMAAYDELIAKTGYKLFEDISALIWCAMAPMFMAAMLPTDNEPSERPKAFNVLFWFLVPIGMVLMAILYAYIAKIVITWSMPSGKMNWFASCAIGGYLFFWLSLRGSPIRLFAFIARWGWATLLPVVVTQIVGIVIRYNAHGLTSPRMAGMAMLAIGIYALALAALDRSARSAFLVLAVAGILFAVSPFNIVDVPIRQQTARLRDALERTGCLVDGNLVVPEKPDIPIEDAKVIDSAWEYLATDSRTFFRHRRQDDDNSLHLRPGVWRSNEFAEGILESARKLSGGNNPDLVALLKINRRKLKGGASYTTNMFALESGCGALDISRYKSMEIAASPRFWHEEGKYFVTLQGSSNTNRYDVTEHVKKLLGNSGANANYSDGLYHSCKLKAEDAIWALSPSLSIVVRYITLRHPESEQGDSSFTCYILRL